MKKRQFILISVIVAVCILGSILTAGCISSEPSKEIQHPIDIDITSPLDGESTYHDHAPPILIVYCTILSDNEIESAYVLSTDYDKVTEIKTNLTHDEFLPDDTYHCTIPTSLGPQKFSVEVTDVLGNTASKTVNYTAYGGLPPPPDAMRL